MKLPQTLSAEEQSRRWWIAWRSVDFSWAALESKYIGNNTEEGEGQTLQSYWRTEPSTGNTRSDDILISGGELERDTSGNLWHLVHVPLHWDDGTPTWKADRNHEKWQLFWRIVSDRLEASNIHVFNGKASDETSSVADLSGVIFGNVSEDWFWHNPLSCLNARFLTCAFLGRVSFYGVKSMSHLDIRHCLFSRAADFDGVNINGDLRLDGAVFLSHLGMLRAEISGNLEMTECNVYGELSLLSGRIKGEMQSSSSIFHGPCGFEETKFWSKVNISWCRFLNITSFASVQFRGNALFLQNRFVTDIVFTGRCYKKFKCIDCQLTSASFAFFVVLGEAWFARSRFNNSALFQAVRFCQKTSFRNVVFESDVRFERVRFKSEVEFHNGVFKDLADFSGCHLPKDARFHHGAFRGAGFRKTADFTIEHFTAWGAFAECVFHQRLLFSRQTLDDPSSFKMAFEAADNAASTAGNARERTLEIHRRFTELESAFQSLKLGMARQQARPDEHRFYRLELLARKRYSTSWLEKGMIWLYDFTSLCGVSFMRPLWILIVLTVVFGFGYWASTRTSSELFAALKPLPFRSFDDSFVDAERFSLENTLNPLSVWKEGSRENHPRDAWARSFLNEGNAIRFLGVRIIATLQSLVAVSLLFLAALGVKRHFQIRT